MIDTTRLNKANSSRFEFGIETMGRVFGFMCIAYYLIPRSPFRVAEPGWWLTYVLTIPLMLRYVASALFCLIAIIMFALITGNNRSAIRDKKNALGEIPAWLPVLILFVPTLTALANQGQNADIAAAICSTILAFSTGIFSALIAKTARKAIVTLLICVVIQAGFALYYRTIFGNVILSGALWREGGTFNNPNTLSMLALIGSTLALVMFVLVNRNGKGLGYGIVAAIALAALLTTWSRAGFISLGLALTYFSIKYVPQRFTKIVIVICACFLVILVIHIRSAGIHNSVSTHQATSNRLIIWKQGIQELKNHWLTGVGVGPMLIHISAPTSGSEGKFIPQTVDGPKNVILYFMDELGIVGLIIPALAFICIRRMLSNCITATPEAISLSTAWLALMLYSLVDTAFGGPGQYCGNAVVGYLYGTTAMLSGAYSQQFKADRLTTSITHA